LLVEDDGVGIPESKLATLLDRGIGVSNVNERLKVLFGNEYRMWIDSQPGRGTRIQIEVPELQTDITPQQPQNRFSGGADLAAAG
jgi:two-component system LytT family sensor kinase